MHQSGTYPVHRHDTVQYASALLSSMQACYCTVVKRATARLLDPRIRRLSGTQPHGVPAGRRPARRPESVRIAGRNAGGVQACCCTLAYHTDKTLPAALRFTYRQSLYAPRVCKANSVANRRLAAVPSKNSNVPYGERGRLPRPANRTGAAERPLDRNCWSVVYCIHGHEARRSTKEQANSSVVKNPARRRTPLHTMVLAIKPHTSS